MSNPNCPECHGTGFYTGSLHGIPEPCSLCSVTIDPQFEIPTPKWTPIDVKIKPEFFSLAWKQCWSEKVDEVIEIHEKTHDLLQIIEGYRAWRLQIGCGLSKVRQASDIFSLVRCAVDAAYNTAVWRIAERYTRGQPVTEKAYICPEVDIKGNEIRMFYFGDWRRQR